MDILTIGSYDAAEPAGVITRVGARPTPDLDRLAQEGRRFDVVFLNSDSPKIEALAESILAWDLLKVGGTIMWTNRYFDQDGTDVDVASMFYRAFAPCLEETQRDTVLAAVKLTDRPSEAVQ